MTECEIEQKIVDNKKLVYFVINKFFPDLNEDEDIIQVGMIGLWKACINYEEQRSNFSTYATACILNEIRMELRNRAKEKKKGVMISLDERVVNQEDDHDMTALINMIPDERDSTILLLHTFNILSTRLENQSWEMSGAHSEISKD